MRYSLVNSTSMIELLLNHYYLNNAVTNTPIQFLWKVFFIKVSCTNPRQISLIIYINCKIKKQNVVNHMIKQHSSKTT